MKVIHHVIKFRNFSVDMNSGHKEAEDRRSPQRQTSLDSGYTGDLSAGSDMAARTGFRPLSMYAWSGQCLLWWQLIVT